MTNMSNMQSMEDIISIYEFATLMSKTYVKNVTRSRWILTITSFGPDTDSDPLRLFQNVNLVYVMIKDVNM